MRTSHFPLPWRIPLSVPHSAPNLTYSFACLSRSGKRRSWTVNGGRRAFPLVASCSVSSVCGGSDGIGDGGGQAVGFGEDFVVVNFYRFVFVEDPGLEISKHLSFLQGLDIHGRIYLNEQGINAQFSGPSKDALAYVEWIKEDNRFSDMLVQVSPSLNGHAFPRLRLRYKPSLVQVEGGNLDLPLLDPSMRATPLTPLEWRQRLDSGVDDGDVSSDNSTKNYILLDVRNGYEWDVGHFDGALRPDVDCFKSTSFGLSELEVNGSDPLANIDKEKTDVLMYCTGGIRCDVYSTMLRQRGFQRLYTLNGGVSHYLEKEGPASWIGNLFVFDSRLSLPPSTFKPGSDQALASVNPPNNTDFAKCYVCGSQVHELRHRNCANLDCNLLFLCCDNCRRDLRGCCCSRCMLAPRLRPVLQGAHRQDNRRRRRRLRGGPDGRQRETSSDAGTQRKATSGSQPFIATTAAPVVGVFLGLGSVIRAKIWNLGV